MQKRRELLLLRLAERWPRNGNPCKSKIHSRLLGMSIAFIDLHGHPNVNGQSGISFRMFLFPNKFPRLLAKREIIANAYCQYVCAVARFNLSVS